MKFNTTLPSALRPYFEEELHEYEHVLKQGDLQKAWHHLERAHIIGQQYPFAHNHVHWKMLLFGIRVARVREVFGQLSRLFFGGVKSFVGKVPSCTIGGSSVPHIKPYPIPHDIQNLYTSAGLQ